MNDELRNLMKKLIDCEKAYLDGVRDDAPFTLRNTLAGESMRAEQKFLDAARKVYGELMMEIKA
jgi:hypothetical protein